VITGGTRVPVAMRLVANCYTPFTFRTTFALSDKLKAKGSGTAYGSVGGIRRPLA